MSILRLPDGSEIPVTDGLVVGRDPRAGVVLADTKASRRHARLIEQGGVVEIEDLDSSNGTMLNGKPVQKRLLRDGDEIRIGRTTIRFVEKIDGTVADAGGVGAGEDLFADEEAEPPDRVESVEVIRESTPHSTAPVAPPGASPGTPAGPVPPKPERPASPRPAPAEGVPAAGEPAAEPSRPASPPPEPARPKTAPPASRPAPEAVPFEPVVEMRAPKDAAAPEPAAEVLEFADDDVVVVKKSAADLEGRKPAAAKAPDRAGGVLQFHKVEDRSGLAVQDLGQMSGPMRALLTLVALAVAVGLFYVAMQLAS